MYRMIVVWRACAMMALSLSPSASAQTYPLEHRTVVGNSTGLFHLELLSGRWWIIAPDGNADFIRSISVFDTTNGSDWHGGFRSYDKVLAKGVDVTPSAMDSHPSDTGTYQNVGDSLTIGANRFRPEYVFMQASQGAGGSLRWYYYGANGWTLINGNGLQYATATPYQGVASNGFLASSCATCSRVTLWNPSMGWPQDFTVRTISSIDSTPRYYLRAQVSTAYTTPLTLSQVYERANPDELVRIRYGGKYATPYIRWINNDTAKLLNWGINGVGYYSFRYNQCVNSSGDGGVTVTQKLPQLAVFDAATLVMRADSVYSASPIKNVYGNVHQEGVCPGQYEGRTPDVLDPSYSSAMAAWARKAITEAKVDPAQFYALVPEEADDLYGLNNIATHQHLGFIIAAANPYMPTDTGSGQVYSDPILYSKYALRSWLQGKYSTLAALNASWGTDYTTWDTSSGSVSNGTNAYGRGSGFMDEDGTGIYAGPSNCSSGTALNYVNNFSNPSVRADLDAFVTYFAQTYGIALKSAIASTGIAHPPVFEPLYKGPDMAYSGVGPYVDGFWTNPGHSGTHVSVTPTDTVADVARIYADAHKPIVVADYQTANAMSQDYFYGQIETISGNLITTDPDFTYNFARSNTLMLMEGSCTQATTVTKVDWNAVKGSVLTLVSPLTCSSLGNHVGLRLPVVPGDWPTRTQEASSMIARWGAVLNWSGDDGVRPVVGFEHWSLYDEAVSEYASPPRAFGFFTVNDNPVDGVSDTLAAGVDANGYPSGGEEANYGNLLTGPKGVGTFLANIYQHIM